MSCTVLYIMYSHHEILVIHVLPAELVLMTVVAIRNYLAHLPPCLWSSTVDDAATHDRDNKST